jgi:hypothetical protein
MTLKKLSLYLLPKFSTVPFTHRQENRRLVGHFYDMKNRFWAVGCGLGWAVEQKVWADYLEEFFISETGFF